MRTEEGLPEGSAFPCSHCFKIAVRMYHSRSRLLSKDLTGDVRFY
uniref:Uncharacterized protein n=1 Tax=Utricularia reniformis TaxID=192314 RepID=A0A1Y0B142_9LAMI|nr:hypothetical protein AEK19_MT0913 [Utricularia reniformis]ART31140.1 hypothetical protein AEK19_MT0913 [Utricularia reniformis]